MNEHLENGVLHFVQVLIGRHSQRNSSQKFQPFVHWGMIEGILGKAEPYSARLEKDLVIKCYQNVAFSINSNKIQPSNTSLAGICRGQSKNVPLNPHWIPIRLFETDSSRPHFPKSPSHSIHLIKRRRTNSNSFGILIFLTNGNYCSPQAPGTSSAWSTTSASWPPCTAPAWTRARSTSTTGPRSRSGATPSSSPSSSACPAWSSWCTSWWWWRSRGTRWRTPAASSRGWVWRTCCSFSFPLLCRYVTRFMLWKCGHSWCGVVLVENIMNLFRYSCLQAHHAPNLK